MTPEEEITYLADLLMQAALWRVQPDEGRTPLELEVLDRLEKLKAYSAAKLTGGKSKDELAKMKEEAAARVLNKSDFQALEAAKLNYHLEHVKVKVGGKWKTMKKSDCIQVPFKCSRTGYKWVPKEGMDVEAGNGQEAEQHSAGLRGDEEHRGPARQDNAQQLRTSIPLVARGLGGDCREVGRIRLQGSGGGTVAGNNGPLQEVPGMQPEGGDLF